MSDGEIAGRYRLEELLGRGASAEVWRAHDRELGRTVALKLLAPTAEGDRFRREAQAVASLSHENVTQLFDYGEAGDRPYMVLEYLPGGTLENRLAGGPLPVDEARRIAHGVAAGLAHAHARGVIHRDLKAANVLFDAEGRPKLVDFGIARVVAGDGTLTEEGTVLGTAATISPEQAAGEPAGPASDVYSFGVLLFRMLAGRLPFESTDPFLLLALHREAPPPPVETLRDGVPSALAALTAAALAKDPADRPADGAALLAAMDAAEPPAAETTLLLPPAAGTTSARSRRAGGLAAALLVLAAAGGGLAWAVTRPPSGSTPPPTGTGPTLAPLTHTPKHPRTTTARVTQLPAARPTTSAPPTTTAAATTTRRRTTTRAATTTAATTTQATTTSPPSTIAPPTTPAPPTATTPATTAPPTTTATVSTTTAATTTAP